MTTPGMEPIWLSGVSPGGVVLYSSDLKIEGGGLTLGLPYHFCMEPHMKSTNKQPEYKPEAKKQMSNTERQLRREKFEKARKALYEYWKNT